MSADLNQSLLIKQPEKLHDDDDQQQQSFRNSINPNERHNDIISKLWFDPEYYEILLYNKKVGLLAFMMKKYGSLLSKYKVRHLYFRQALLMPIQDRTLFRFAVLTIIVAEPEVREMLLTSVQETGDKEEDEKEKEHMRVFFDYLVVQHQLLRTSDFTHNNAKQLIQDFIDCAFLTAWLPRNIYFMRQHSVPPVEVVSSNVDNFLDKMKKKIVTNPPPPPPPVKARNTKANRKKNNDNNNNNNNNNNKSEKKQKELELELEVEMKM